MYRNASAEWTGDLRHGKGTMSTSSGSLKNLPYSFTTRFESTPGTNPEELVAAAHAGCFSMAFSGGLGRAGFTPGRITTSSQLTLEKVGEAWTITAIHLTMTASVPGIPKEKFAQIAEDAKANCPVSRLLKAKITLEANLE